MITKLLSWAVAFAIGMCTIAQAQTSPTALEWKQALEGMLPLPKVHLAAGTPLQQLNAEWEAANIEFARVTGAVSVLPYAVSIDEAWSAIVDIAEVSGKPLAVNFSVWQRCQSSDDPLDYGPRYWCELRLMKRRLKEISWKADCGHVAIGWVLLDSEKYRTNGEFAHDDAIRKRHDEVFDLVHDILPDAEIIEYRNGAWPEGGFDYAQAQSRSVALYEIYNRSRTQQQIGTLAVKWPDVPLVAYVGITGAWIPGSHWDYKYALPDLELSRLGKSLNNIVEEPFRRFHVMVFNTHPFEQRNSRNLRHFEAYVRGATGN